jgi:hypothetical protein
MRFTRLSAIGAAGLILALGAGGAAQAQSAKAGEAKPAAAAAPTKMVLEPRALDLLKAASDRLAAAKSMTFTAIASYEYPSQLGPPILYTVRYDVAMQRPDKLRVVMPGDGPASAFYYDGKTMTAYAPKENLAAVADAPPTIGGALEAAFKQADIYFPFSDLLMPDPYAALADGGLLAFYVGPSDVVGGTRTEMIVYVTQEVFLQFWIGADDKLPRRIRANYRADPLHLRHQLDLSDWQLDPTLAADAFTSDKAQAAQPMSFDRPSNAPTPPGAKPLGNARSAGVTAAQPTTKSP